MTDVGQDQADAAVAVLDDAKSVDIDAQVIKWRADGWTGKPAASPTKGDDDQTLQVIEERLVVGKREVKRGGVRVRSYVTETPVHVQIRLREETVKVERRPVDRAVTGADAFNERTIEMTEKSEEAVVGKEARIVEEVVIGKTSSERVETVEDKVRKTNVEVEQLDGKTTSSDTTKRKI